MAALRADEVGVSDSDQVNVGAKPTSIFDNYCNLYIEL